MTPRRFAGYRLAGLPLENVKSKVKEAADVLKANQTPLPDYVERVKIPGTDDDPISVVMEAFPSNTTFEGNFDDVQGNPTEIQKIIDAQPPGILTLGWGLDNHTSNLTDKQRFAAARIAQKEFKRILNDIPNGTIVKNAPVGGLNGNYTRADAYMNQGMGPLQGDGVQYAIMNNGEMQPLSPFTPLVEHAEHLAQRAERGGQGEISQLIRDELKLRGKNSNNDSLPVNRSREWLGDYDEDDDFMIPGRQWTPEIEKEEARGLSNQAFASENRWLVPPTDPLSARRLLGERPYIPEIHIRDQAKQRLSRNRLDVTDIPDPTPRNIQAFRTEQIQHAIRPSIARDLTDQVEQVFPRPSPPILSINDSGTILQDRLIPTRLRSSEITNETQRRAILRDRAGNMFTGQGSSGDAPSDPNWMRRHSRENAFFDQSYSYLRNGVNSPQIVDDMRAYQTIGLQANPYLESPMQQHTFNRTSSNPNIISLAPPSTRPPAYRPSPTREVDEIRNAIGLQNVGGSDDIPF